MNPVWLRIAEIELAPWKVDLVHSRIEATVFSSGDVQQAMRGANLKFPMYSWKQVQESSPDRFIVQGDLKFPPK